MLQATFAQGAEAAIVSARVILIISLLHFLIIFLAVLVSYPLGDTTRHILFYVAPPLVFISGILFNQFGIFYFNIVMNHTVFVPIVNTKGDVMGKAIASEAINRKNDYINPVIRIAVASHSMLFLLPRPKCNVFEKINRLADGGLPDIWRNIGTRRTQNFTTNASHRPIRPFALQLHVSF